MEDFSLPPALRQSAELHQRVRSFARAALAAPSGVEPDAETFETLALALARFQAEMSPGFARLLLHHGNSVGALRGGLHSLSDIPPLPTDAFRLARVAVHPPELDAVVFETSGTTSDATGRHFVRDLMTKEELSLLQAERTLFLNHPRALIVALAEPPGGARVSSLTHLMSLFIRHFDGRPLTSDPRGAVFTENAAGRFLFGAGGADIDGLRRAAKLARHRSEPLFILTTAFALASTLELLEEEPLSSPKQTHMMLTGGFKGKRSDLSESELRARAASLLRMDPACIISEYGMTELTSQLFEVPGTRTYEAPPWLRVIPLDPATLRPVSEGTPGLAHFLDLGNVDSSVSVLTEDLVSVQEGRITLHGRAPRAEARGCSLPYEKFQMGAPGQGSRRSS